jgi:hypothetical protein
MPTVLMLRPVPVKVNVSGTLLTGMLTTSSAPLTHAYFDPVGNGGFGGDPLTPVGVVTPPAHSVAFVFRTTAPSATAATSQPGPKKDLRPSAKNNVPPHVAPGGKMLKVMLVISAYFLSTVTLKGQAGVSGSVIEVGGTPKLSVNAVGTAATPLGQLPLVVVGR